MEDVNKAVMALQMADVETLDRTGGAIRGRAARICGVVDAEMQNYEPGVYTDKVKEAVLVLQDQGKHYRSENGQASIAWVGAPYPTSRH